jgi:divalent metal cation (Fe/Co/Zn/Cd) transporter
MRSLLIGEGASDEMIEQIKDALTDRGKLELIHMRTNHLGPDELLVAAKLAFPPDLAFHEVAEQIDAAEARVRSAVPIARLIYIEPDVLRPNSVRSVATLVPEADSPDA